MSGPPAKRVLPATPWRDDGGTTEPRATASTAAATALCAVCNSPFLPVGRQRYCRPSCRKTAYRRRSAATAPTIVPAAVGRRERTVFQCPDCDSLQLGVQRCPDCQIFGRSLGLGGCCPHCDEPVTLNDLDLSTT